MQVGAMISPLMIGAFVDKGYDWNRYYKCVQAMVTLRSSKLTDSALLPHFHLFAPRSPFPTLRPACSSYRRRHGRDSLSFSMPLGFSLILAVIGFFTFRGCAFPSSRPFALR